MGGGAWVPTNLLRSRKLRATNAAEQAGSALASHGGNLVTAALAGLDGGAWVVDPSTASRERTVFLERLEGAGSAVIGAFRSQEVSCRAEWHSEPADVDPDDPDEGWKAESARIDARIAATSFRRR